MVSVIALVLSILSFSALFHKKENEDEMYKRHIGSASNLTLGLITLLLIILAKFYRSLQ